MRTLEEQWLRSAKKRTGPLIVCEKIIEEQIESYSDPNIAEALEKLKALIEEFNETVGPVFAQPAPILQTQNSKQTR